MKRRSFISLHSLRAVTWGAIAWGAAILNTPCHGQDPFVDQIAPILQRRCVACHNELEHKGGFSLQTAQSLFAQDAVVPGDADASLVIDLITPVDGAAEMPKNGPPLPAGEIEQIRRWIEQGASWPTDYEIAPLPAAGFDGWSYQPLLQPPVPSLSDEWGRTPIDAFVFQELRAHGLSPTAEADRRTLIRRLYYDLWGLPPTPQAVAAFERDPDPLAYEHLVDSLLDSPHYGERWGQHWLDIVQYADTCGYDKDKLRPNAWPYRDYVIQSFNRDKPYSRFVQEQIAGDVLFPGEPDGILGLGFIAAGPWDFIGHVEVSESKIDGQVARYLDRDDMVANTFNTFCSVTVQCARCHDHKFDPITQEQYYGLQAIFAAVDRADRPYAVNPEIAETRRDLEQQLKNQTSSLDDLDHQVQLAGGEELAELNAQINRLRGELSVETLPEFGYHSEISPRRDAVKWVALDLGQSVDGGTIILMPCYDEYAGIGPGFGFPLRFKVETSTDAMAWSLVADHTESDIPNPGMIPLTLETDQTFQFLRITATRLAERDQDYIFALAEVRVVDGGGKNVAAGAAVTALDSIEAPVRWSRSNLTDEKWPRANDRLVAAAFSAAGRDRADLLQRLETVEIAAARVKIQGSIQAIRRELEALPGNDRLVYAAATEFEPQGSFQPTRGKPRDVHVLRRGDVQSPLESAIPGVLPIHSSDPWQLGTELAEGERRAALARWLTREDQPWLWRSIVNRVWQYHFGQGIVATPNDFGLMGARPTHPELLDWLACHFRDGGQSLKQLHRLIVLSSVYRQASTGNSDMEAIDGSNQYLWRMNRRRLEAEEVRDSILSVSGAIDLTMGGPGYYLFELEKTEHSPHYEYQKFDPSDPRSHRRSIYRFVVRSQPDPWMTTLDCADASQSSPKRSETLTSLQALTLLNNPFNLEMAQTFAVRLQHDANTLEAQVRRAMQLLVQREPDADEQRALLAYARKHGLANLCRYLFNFSEFIFVD